MFDRTAIFEVKVLSGTEKLFPVRFPTDAELISRARKLITITRANGQTELKNFGPVEAEFVAKLRSEGAPELEMTEGEAIYVADRLLRASVTGVERTGDQFRIAIRVAKGEVVHVLRIPTLDEARKFGKTRYKSDPKRHTVETHENLEGVAPFWASVKISVDGYNAEDDIPVNHKEAAITELIAQMHLAMEDVDPED